MKIWDNWLNIMLLGQKYVDNIEHAKTVGTDVVI